MDARGPLRQLYSRIWAVSRKPGGHVALLFLATLLWALLWAWFDVMVVRMAFPPPNSAASNVAYYWLATWDFIFPLATFLAFREHAWFPIAAILGGAWEDLLFYWIQGIPVPAVTAPMFYARALAFLPLSVLAEAASHRVAPRRVVAAMLVAVALVAAFVDPLIIVLFVAAFLVYVALTEVGRLLTPSGGREVPWFGRAK